MYHINTSIGKREAGGSEFEVTLVYIASFTPVKYVLRHKAKQNRWGKPCNELATNP